MKKAQNQTPRMCIFHVILITLVCFTLPACGKRIKQKKVKTTAERYDKRSVNGKNAQKKEKRLFFKK